MEFRILGPVAVTDGADEVAIGGSRQRRLLGALLVDGGRVVEVDRLIDVVWGDEPQPPDGAGLSIPPLDGHLV